MIVICACGYTVYAAENLASGKSYTLSPEPNYALAKDPDDHIHLTDGKIYDIEDVNQFYNFCDVVIGSGRGLMEAMACKKPVIIPGESGQAELLGLETIDAIAHYNFSGRHFRMHPNTTALAEVINDVSTNPDILSPTAAFCYDYVQKHLSARVGAAELIEWYNKPETANHDRIDFGLWYLEACYWKFRTSLKLQPNGLSNMTQNRSKTC